MQHSCYFTLDNTLPETNIFPENQRLEYWFAIGIAYFSGYVSFRECNYVIIMEFWHSYIHPLFDQVSPYFFSLPVACSSGLGSL